MVLIADSGSTKTDWALIDANKNVSYFQTIGLSPYFLSSAQIEETLLSNLLYKFSSDTVSAIHFYGTGLGNDNNKKIIESSLNTLFPAASVIVNNDLLGAARAVCGKEEGMVAILGTGSNSCVFDGEKIIENAPSLGFILGDEGSGAYIGKKLIQSFLNNEMPDELNRKFASAYSLNKNDILEAIYKKQFPNRYLAFFSKFISDNIDHEWAAGIAASSFEDFFNKQICKYAYHNQLALSCVGSIAFYFRDILSEVAESKGVHIKKIMDKPIEGLIHYHSEKI